MKDNLFHLLPIVFWAVAAVVAYIFIVRLTRMRFWWAVLCFVPVLIFLAMLSFMAFGA